MIEQIDHLAMGVRDIDERISFFTGVLGWTLGRRGTHIGSGGRIAFVSDPATGFKIELIETPDRQEGLMHLAFRVDDVAASRESLLTAGLEGVRGPLRLDAGKAETALLRDATGMEVQIIRYDADSPDLT